MKSLVALLIGGTLLMAAPAVAQKKKEDKTALSSNQSYNSSAIFGGSAETKSKKSRLKKSGKSASDLQRDAYKRNKKAYKTKGKSDCDCPGSKKGKRIRQRQRAS